MKRAYQVFQERGFRSRVLSAAFRNVMQWSELVGGDVVVSPPFGWQKIIQGFDYVAVPKMDARARGLHRAAEPSEDFRRAYEVDGMTKEEFQALAPRAAPVPAGRRRSRPAGRRHPRTRPLILRGGGATDHH